MGFLLRQTEGPWARAAVVASLLDPVQVAEAIRDPYERACLNRFRPERPSHGAPDSPAAHLVSRIMTAEDPDEISWLRADLGQAVAEARETHPAPRPTQRAEPGVVPEPAGSSPAHSSRTRSSPVASRPVVPAPAAPASAAAVPGVSTAVASRPQTATREDLPAAGEREWPRGLLGWLRRRST